MVRLSPGPNKDHRWSICICDARNEGACVSWPNVLHLRKAFVFILYASNVLTIQGTEVHEKLYFLFLERNTCIFETFNKISWNITWSDQRKNRCRPQKNHSNHSVFCCNKWRHKVITQNKEELSGSYFEKQFCWQSHRTGETSTLSQRKGRAPQPSITFSCQAGKGGSQ